MFLIPESCCDWMVVKFTILLIWVVGYWVAFYYSPSYMGVLCNSIRALIWPVWFPPMIRGDKI